MTNLKISPLYLVKHFIHTLDALARPDQTVSQVLYGPRARCPPAPDLRHKSGYVLLSSKALHWLPITFQVKANVFTVTHRTLDGRVPGVMRPPLPVRPSSFSRPPGLWAVPSTCSTHSAPGPALPLTSPDPSFLEMLLLLLLLLVFTQIANLLMEGFSDHPT